MGSHYTLGSGLCGLPLAGWTTVVHDLDVVAVGIEDEGRVIASVVDRALARRAVVQIAGRNCGAVERLDGGVGSGRECEVDVLGRRPVVDDGERAVSRAEVGPVRPVGAEREARKRGDRLVETL